MCCPSGSYAPPGASSCTLCSPGKYSNAPGAAACTDCDINSYNSIEGATECSICDDGSISTAGSTNCTECPANTYKDYGTSFQVNGNWYFRACPGDDLDYNACSCYGDTVLELYVDGGERIALSDDSCGACSRITYTFSGNSCQRYRMFQRCFSGNNCGASPIVSLTGTPPFECVNCQAGYGSYRVSKK